MLSAASVLYRNRSSLGCPKRTACFWLGVQHRERRLIRRTHVWAANGGGNSVTELDAATGALVRVITGTKYRFNGPYGISSDGTHVWVANESGDSVTELEH